MRTKILTDRQYREIYEACDTNRQIGIKAGLSHAAVYRYNRRLGLPHKRGPAYAPAKETQDKIEQMWLVPGTVTKTIADELGLHKATVRYHLRRVIKDYMRRDPRLPRPPRISLIRVMHLLTNDWELFDEPDVLAARTGISRKYVQLYVSLIYNRIRRGTR